MRRRTTLALLAGGAVAPACARSRPDPRLRVPLASVPESGRAVVEHAGEPIELQRTGCVLHARSLVCSHYGCRVEWQPERSRYACPCHQGEFDAEGRPVSGPPTRPLRTIPVSVSGGIALVGER